MRRQSRTKLVPPRTEPNNQFLEQIEESSLQEQKEESVLSELDMEMACPRCNGIEFKLRCISILL